MLKTYEQVIHNLIEYTQASTGKFNQRAILATMDTSSPECERIRQKELLLHLGVVSTEVGRAVRAQNLGRYDDAADRYWNSALAVVLALYKDLDLGTIHENLLLDYVHMNKERPGKTLDTEAYSWEESTGIIGEGLSGLFAHLHKQEPGSEKIFYREATRYIGLCAQHIVRLERAANDTE